MKKNIIEITAAMAEEVGVILRGGTRFVASYSLVSKGRKVGSETAAVNACNEKQARLAIKRVMEARAGEGIGVKIVSCTVNEQEATSEEVVAMNTHKQNQQAQAKKEDTKIKNNEIKKVALVGETVDYTALAEALKTEGKKLLVGDATNKNHLNALFKVKGGSFKDIMVQAYLAHRGETPAYTPEKLGFIPVTLSILSFMSNELRAQLMKEALTNKAFVLISNAPAPTTPPDKKEKKKEVIKSQPSPAEVKKQVCSELVKLGYEMSNGQDVVAEINKFGSYAVQCLKMTEAEVNALIQKGVSDARERKGAIIP